MQPMQITWHVNQVHLKHASRNTQASTAAVLENISIQLFGCGKVLQIVISAYFGSLQQLTPDDHIQPQQPQFSRPRAQVLHLMVAAVIGWRTSPWIGSSHWSPMSRRSVPTEMTHRLTMIPERIGDLGPHEDRDPNQLWHPGILTGPSSWSENCSKKSSGNSSKRDYIIILNVLDKSSSTLSPENHTLSRSSGKNETSKTQWDLQVSDHVTLPQKRSTFVGPCVSCLKFGGSNLIVG